MSAALGVVNGIVIRSVRTRERETVVGNRGMDSHGTERLRLLSQWGDSLLHCSSQCRAKRRHAQHERRRVYIKSEIGHIRSILGCRAHRTDSYGLRNITKTFTEEFRFRHRFPWAFTVCCPPGEYRKIKMAFRLVGIGRYVLYFDGNICRFRYG